MSLLNSIRMNLGRPYYYDQNVCSSQLLHSQGDQTFHWSNFNQSKIDKTWNSDWTIQTVKFMEIHTPTKRLTPMKEQKENTPPSGLKIKSISFRSVDSPPQILLNLDAPKQGIGKSPRKLQSLFSPRRQTIKESPRESPIKSEVRDSPRKTTNFVCAKLIWNAI